MPPFLNDQSLLAKNRVRAMRQLRRLPGVEAALKIGRQLERGRYIDRLASLITEIDAVFPTFVRDGVAKLPIAEMGVAYEETIASTKPFLERLERGEGTSFGQTSKHIPLEDLVVNAEPMMFGLQDAFIDFAERYFGLPCDYLGVDMKRELANGKEEGVRNWHYDTEDVRMMKLIVYLSDVDDGAGPFQAVRGPRADLYRRQVDYLWGDVYSTEEVSKLVPPSEWYVGTGAKLSVHIIDPVRLLHRAGPPTKTDRYSMTYSYASKSAHFAFESARITQNAFLKRHSQRLSPKQLRAVTP